MQSKLKLQLLIHTINVSIFGLILTYQACSRQYGIQLNSLVFPEKCQEGSCKIGKVNPEIDTLRPSTKVMFVVDNSRTMSLSQKYLAEGVSSLAQDLHGFNADFFVYSTSDAHGKALNIDGSQREKDDKPVIQNEALQTCSWTEKDGNSIVQKSTAGPCPNNNPTVFTSEQSKPLNSSLGSKITFRHDDNESVLESSNDKLSQSLLNVGIDGSSNETGLCTLVRSVYDESVNAPFKKGDNAVMVVLSDEDDHSTPQSCISRITQSESFEGQSAVTLKCDPKTEKCDEVDYKLSFNQGRKPFNFAEVKADYKCDTLVNGSCGIGEKCSKVNYDFSSLRSKINYSCLKSVNYSVNFNSDKTYSRGLSFGCFGSVPYTIKIKPLPTFAKRIGYQCQQFEDGVPVAGQIKSYQGPDSGSTKCEDGQLTDCGASDIVTAKNLALGSCPKDAHFVESSCKLKCIVGSKSVAPIIFKDSSSEAMGRDLSSSGVAFKSGAILYSDFSDWITKTNPGQNYIVENIVRGSADSVNKTLPISGSAQCTLADSGGCNSSQSALALNACGASTPNLMVGSCKASCSEADLPVSSITYSDSRIEADLYDLTDSSKSFVDESDGNKVYKNFLEWATAHYYPKIVSGITKRNLNKSSAESFVDQNCNSENSVGVGGIQCVESADQNFAVGKCGGKKVLGCNKKCMPESHSMALSKLSEDTVNYCSNTDPSKKFTAPGGGQYKNLQDYMSSIYAGTAANPNSCVRTGDGLKSIAQSTLVSKPEDKLLCDGQYDSVFNIGSLCSNSGLNQKGLSTEGLTNVSCIMKTKEINDPLKPAKTDIPLYTDLSKSSESICESPFTALGGKTYSSLRAYALLNYGGGRLDSPNCEVVAARKVSVPAGIQSKGKSPAVSWTFPRNVEASDTNANLENAFLSKSKDLFGDNGFFVSAIIRDQQEEDQLRQSNPELKCADFNADHSPGVKYRHLVEAVTSTSPEVKGDISSICASDYSKSLKSVSNWIKENARRTVYLPDIGEKTEVLSVWLFNEGNGEELPLVLGTDYGIVGNKINFINPQIDPKGWQIKYMIFDPK